MSGDLSDQLRLYDLGTEEDQQDGFGLDQVQNQVQPNSGAPDTDTSIRPLELEHSFKLTIEPNLN